LAPCELQVHTPFLIPGQIRIFQGSLGLYFEHRFGCVRTRAGMPEKNTLLSINIESTVFLEGDFDVNFLWENPDSGTRKNPKNIMIKIRVFNIAECREKLFGR